MLGRANFLIASLAVALVAGCGGKHPPVAAPEPERKWVSVTEVEDPALYKITREIVGAITEKSEQRLAAVTDADTAFIERANPGEGGLAHSYTVTCKVLALRGLGPRPQKTCVYHVKKSVPLLKDGARRPGNTDRVASAFVKWTDHEQEGYYLDLHVSLVLKEDGKWRISRVELSSTCTLTK